MTRESEDNAVQNQSSSGDMDSTIMAIMSTSQARGVDLPTIANPSSTRTSITHVENEEEARPQRPITIETPVIPTTTTMSNPTTPVAQLPLPVYEEGRPVSSSSSSIQTTLEPSSSRKDAVPVMVAVTVPQPEADVEIPQTPQVYVTFLVISGKRRTLAFDPCTTIARVKELAWNSWPSELDWQDERPPAPSYLRVLYLGRMLQDDETLTTLKLPASSPNSQNATIIHLSVRPSALAAQGESMNKKGRLGRGRSNNAESNEGDGGANPAGCCRCIIC